MTVSKFSKTVINSYKIRVEKIYSRLYFYGENQIGRDNPHDHMTPNLSAKIIISHVKNGIELAKNSIEAVFEQEFNFYRTFTLPENKLFITYS